MGGTPSFLIPKELPRPTKSYTPTSVAKHAEIESLIDDILIKSSTIILWKIIPVMGKLAKIAEYPTQFFDYTNALTSVIDLLSGNNGYDPRMQLIEKKIKEQAASTQFALINAKIKTIKSRLEEIFDPNSNDMIRQSKAGTAEDKCEEILHLFDDDKNILWDMGVISSSILIPFSPICAQVIKFKYDQKGTTLHHSKKMKLMLISILEDYKQQCILNRLKFVTVQTRDSCIYSSGVSVKTYSLGNSKFQNDRDLDLDHEWHRSYHCLDAWDNWKERMTTYKSIIDYRKLLIDYYERDFDNAIKMVNDQLVDIKATNEYTKRKKEFCKESVVWSVVPTF